MSLVPRFIPGYFPAALRAGCNRLLAYPPLFIDQCSIHSGDAFSFRPRRVGVTHAARMFFLTPKFVKNGRLYIKEAEKRLDYNRDRWSPEVIELFEGAKARLKRGVDERNADKVNAAADELEKLCGVHCPVGPNTWIGENVEVFLVAIVVALGIRTFFIQPFTIPTASMRPTLFGISGRATDTPKPNILSRVAEFVWAGRTYHEVIAKSDETITKIEETKSMVFFTYTKISTDAGNTYWVNESMRPVTESPFTLAVGKSYKAGDVMIRGFTDTGDHVFVDKISYHFRRPKGGEVFVFDTRNLNTIERRQNSNANTQYYIKRLAAVGGDEIRVDPPRLFINGEVAKGFGYERVMAGTEDTLETQPLAYHGYENWKSPYYGYTEKLLYAPNVKFKVPPRHYFAMGDNSHSSSDSRDWGPVPEPNLMGAGVFVYWPFGRADGGRWGIIK
jgi:signal peptidase I